MNPEGKMNITRIKRNLYEDEVALPVSFQEEKASQDEGCLCCHLWPNMSTRHLAQSHQNSIVTKGTETLDLWVEMCSLAYGAEDSRAWHRL